MTTVERTAPEPLTRTHRLVSADSHVIEPADLWTSRLPAPFRDRAPRTERFERGDAWVLEGVDDPITFGLNAAAGTDPMDADPWKTWEQIGAAGYDAAERLRAMAVDGVDAEILYPTPRLFQYVANVADDDFHLALVRAYNEWLAELCANDPSRLGGLALVTNRGARQARSELERAMALPGMVGGVMLAYPNGSLQPADEDDELWEYCGSERIPLSVHILMTKALPDEVRVKAVPGAFRLWDVPDRMAQMIFAGIFDRFPSLQLVFAEVDCGWLPYYREQLDNGFRRLGGHRKFTLSRLPSDYIDANMWFTFITDSFAMRNRASVGADRMMWSSDYPHNASDWPNSWRTINAATSDVPADERHRILAGTALSLYCLEPLR